MKLATLESGLGRLGTNLGKGVLAGVAGTAAMTLSSVAEAKLRGRKASSVPSKVAGRVLGVQPRNPEGEARFANFIHWSYGAAWGAVGGMMRLAIPEPLASATHFGSLWGTEVTLLPGLEVTPPLSQWGLGEIAIDLFHHVVYVAAFASVWYLLDEADGKDSVLGAIRARLR